jgi:hypothetical protein
MRASATMVSAALGLKKMRRIRREGEKSSFFAEGFDVDMG